MPFLGRCQRKSTSEIPASTITTPPPPTLPRPSRQAEIAGATNAEDQLPASAIHESKGIHTISPSAKGARWKFLVYDGNIYFSARGAGCRHHRVAAGHLWRCSCRPTLLERGGGYTRDDDVLVWPPCKRAAGSQLFAWNVNGPGRTVAGTRRGGVRSPWAPRR